MELSGILPVFLVGCGGGAAVEVYKWYQLRESINLPAYSRSPLYWVLTLLMILIGGALGVLYGTEAVSALLVVNIGASAPAIIRALGAAPPTQLPGGSPAGPATKEVAIPGPRSASPNIRGFLAGR